MRNGSRAERPEQKALGTKRFGILSLPSVLVEDGILEYLHVWMWC